MFAQEDPLVARSNRQVLHLLAYAVWKALAAAQVLVAVDDSSAVMVQGWAGSAALDVDECLLTGVDNIPVEAVTDVRLERLADGSLHVWHEVPPRQGADHARYGGPTGRALRSSARDGVGLVVLVDRPSMNTAREEDEQTLRSLLAAAQDVIAAQQEVNKQRLRSRLEEREGERRRWARELHDETLQQMGALQVLLTSTLRGAGATVLDHDAVLRSLGQASTMLTGQISDLRHLITELRPAALDELGVAPPLRALARRTADLTGLDVDTDIRLRYSDGLVPTRLLPEVEEAVYRVVQEALTNASRHARATRVLVSVVETDAEVWVEVSDDGDGMAPMSPRTKFGLTGMRERAALAGGRLEVVSPRPDADDPDRGGTLIRLVVPARHRDHSATPSEAVPAGTSGAELPHS